MPLPPAKKPTSKGGVSKKADQASERTLGMTRTRRRAALDNDLEDFQDQSSKKAKTASTKQSAKGKKGRGKKK